MMQIRLFIQVGYLKHTKCYRRTDLCLFLVSCPNDDVCSWWKVICYYCFQYSYVSTVSQLLLLMSGDVEMNPGPDTAIAHVDNPGPHTDSAHIASILAAVERIEAAQTDMLAKVVSLERGQKATDISVQQLFSRMEAKLAATDTASETTLQPSQGMSVELANIQKQCEDKENRLRRSNPLFF
ncbi:unnamed protein product, partial [Ixodes pacificus]